MQLVVVMAVRKAVSAATTTFTATCSLRHPSRTPAWCRTCRGPRSSSSSSWAASRAGSCGTSPSRRTRCRGVNTSVLCDVVRQLTGVQTLQILYTAVPLAVSSIALVLVLVHFIDNLRHTTKCFSWYQTYSANYTGWPTPACLSLMIDNAKVCIISMQNKLFSNLFSKSLKC